MPPEPNPAPSDKQLELYKFLISYIEEHGYQPSQGEMAAHFGVSKNAVGQRLRELARRGLLVLPYGEKARERSIVLKHIRFKAQWVPPEGEKRE